MIARVRCVAMHGGCRIGKVYEADLIGPTERHPGTHPRLRLRELPGCTEYPTLFLDSETLEPDGKASWRKFELVEPITMEGSPA